MPAVGKLEMLVLRLFADYASMGLGVFWNVAKGAMLIVGESVGPDGIIKDCSGLPLQRPVSGFYSAFSSARLQRDF